MITCLTFSQLVYIGGGVADPDTDTETDTAVPPATAEPELLRRAKRERERGNLSGIKWIIKHVV